MGPSRWLQILFFALAARPLVRLLIGLEVRGRLPVEGPAIIAPNHDSHLDAIALMTLYPVARLATVRPVAAADHFRRNRVLWWFARRVIGVVPLDRTAHARREDPLVEAERALARGEILILFPEGTRGEPGHLRPLRPGVARLVERVPGTRVVPVRLEGFGFVLPRGDWLVVPRICRVRVGEPLRQAGRRGLMRALTEALGKKSDRRTCS